MKQQHEVAMEALRIIAHGYKDASVAMVMADEPVAAVIAIDALEIIKRLGEIQAEDIKNGITAGFQKQPSLHQGETHEQ